MWLIWGSYRQNGAVHVARRVAWDCKICLRLSAKADPSGSKGQAIGQVYVAGRDVGLLYLLNKMGHINGCISLDSDCAYAFLAVGDWLSNGCIPALMLLMKQSLGMINVITVVMSSELQHYRAQQRAQS